MCKFDSNKNLNDLDLILGADFLFMNERIKAIKNIRLHAVTTAVHFKTNQVKLVTKHKVP